MEKKGKGAKLCALIKYPMITIQRKPQRGDILVEKDYPKNTRRLIEKQRLEKPVSMTRRLETSTPVKGLKQGGRNELHDERKES